MRVIRVYSRIRSSDTDDIRGRVIAVKIFYIVLATGETRAAFGSRRRTLLQGYNTRYIIYFVPV